MAKLAFTANLWSDNKYEKKFLFKVRYVYMILKVCESETRLKLTWNIKDSNELNFVRFAADWSFLSQEMCRRGETSRYFSSLNIIWEVSSRQMGHYSNSNTSSSAYDAIFS